MLPPPVNFISILYGALALLKTANENQGGLPLYKTVVTENGAVRGKLGETFLHGNPYYSFKAIPYAKPPIGELRFKAPVPADSWSPRVIDGTEYGPICMLSLPFFKLDRPMTEDCLTVNVFVPVVKSKEKLPVFAHIVGGGFYTNPTDDAVAGPDFLLDQGIIFVTFGSRLGPFGYMSLDTPEYSGNMGVKDQQMALRWVHENIHHFGGDNTQVTLSGHSAGAISADYQVLNEESRKYFQRVIILSGSALIGYHTGNHECLMHIIARNASKITRNKEELIEYLKTADARQIQDFVDDIENLPPIISWSPIIEREDAINPFLRDEPYTAYEKIKQFNLTSFFSISDKESLFYETGETLQEDVVRDRINRREFRLPIRAFNFTYTEKPYLQDLLQEAGDIYLKNVTEFPQIASGLVDVMSYAQFGYPIEKMTHYHVQKSIQPTYFMRFSVQSLFFGFKNADTYVTPVKGAAHAEDLCYIFKCGAFDIVNELLRSKYQSPQINITLNTIDYMTRLIGNFVKYGNPTYGDDLIKGYKPVTSEDINFVDVTNEGLFLDVMPANNRTKIMDRIVKEGSELIAKNDPMIPDFDLVCQTLKKRS